MLSEGLKKRQNICMGGPCDQELLSDADGINPIVQKRRDGLVHEYELSVFPWGEPKITRYIYRGSFEEAVDPEGETRAEGLD